ncbi:MAG: caspase domain-containing protein [Reyranellales bacterium]
MERFLVVDNKVPAAATHALIIGVGDYPHLERGSGPLSAAADGMGQLTSPPLSALAFAEWLRTKYDNPSAPLATLALLLSEKAPSGWAEPATTANVMAATEAWWERGRKSEDDVLIFFFCGHGVSQGNEMSLLLRDFGARAADPYANAIDFKNFRLGMGRARALRQFFFVDACRSSSDTFAGSGEYHGAPIIAPNLNEFRPKKAPVFFSTLAGDAAYGRAGQMTLFTEALLDGLNGRGASKQNGPWQVFSTRLTEYLTFVMERSGQGQVQVPVLEGGSLMFHHSGGTPTVPLFISCNPEHANGQAALAYCEKGKGVEKRPAFDPAPWEVTVAAGIVDLSAEFPAGGPFQSTQQSESVQPPYQRIMLPVWP